MAIADIPAAIDALTVLTNCDVPWHVQFGVDPWARSTYRPVVAKNSACMTPKASQLTAASWLRIATRIAS